MWIRNYVSRFFNQISPKSLCRKLTNVILLISRLQQSPAQCLHSLRFDERFYKLLNVFKTFLFYVFNIFDVFQTIVSMLLFFGTVSCWNRAGRYLGTAGQTNEEVEDEETSDESLAVVFDDRILVTERRDDRLRTSELHTQHRHAPPVSVSDSSYPHRWQPMCG